MPNVNVSYAEMQTQAQRLHTARTAIDDQLVAMRSQITALVTEGFVTDNASRQFSAHYETFDHGAQQVLEGLSGMALYLDRAATAFENVDAQLAGALGH